MGTIFSNRHFTAKPNVIRKHSVNSIRKPSRSHRLVHQFRPAADEELLAVNRAVVAIAILAILPILALLVLLLFSPDFLTVDMMP